MKQHVSELTPEEFQKTFPITLQEYDPDYQAWYEEEKEQIVKAVEKENISRINHIGSTSIPNIIAKPIVDILLEITKECDVDALEKRLNAIDFGTEVCFRKNDPFELMMAKGMTVEGFREKVFLLHVRYAGEWDELYFRDYLLKYPAAAEEYSQLKRDILDGIEKGTIERMPNGKPNGYSCAKYDFGSQISKKAKKEFKGRYKA